MYRSNYKPTDPKGKKMQHYTDNEEGMRAARAVSQWYIGDPSWAGTILNAYFNPKAAMENLADEKRND